jgi:hypothetical protein
MCYYTCVESNGHRTTETTTMTEAEKKAVLDLLATMHRDGGRYATEHGVEKAARDATELWYRRAEHHSFEMLALRERLESAGGEPREVSDDPT